MPRPLIFELGERGRRASSLPAPDVPERAVEELLPAKYRRTAPAGLPEVSEVELVRHYVRLSQQNYAVDTGFYPLGSCTMKYNPKVNEAIAVLPGFAQLHPYQSEETVQGALELLYRLCTCLRAISGMDAVTLQPAAGAHGELTGIRLVRAYHESRRDGARSKIIVPDSSHGTNPATASMCGYKTATVPSNADGQVDVRALRAMAGPDLAALMLTNPNTLGLFEEQIAEIADVVHGAGGLMYMDGANMNALLGMVRPGDIGFDVMHFNLHKTFSTPHGGGGPGAGPVACKALLEPFLPVPVIAADLSPEGAGAHYRLDWDRPRSIGKVRSFYGNFGILVRAYAYIRGQGGDGLRANTEDAVLNANYLRARLKEAYELPFKRPCMHELVLSGRRQKAQGVRTLDIAKRLMDYGFHPPTIYFPLTVEEALMIEPTETESRQTLDAFADAMLAIAQEAEDRPDVVTSAPSSTELGRLDETLAARHANLRWQAEEENGV
ncbi:MAG: aminomethyl-transferring glycine dehydrogenase subunit GcvPB [Chloroflexota bacterium]|nr:aminomethyl-transferring glycine dehydrogenase subunit GcvPB [Chloroflexota bacterium]